MSFRQWCKDQWKFFIEKVIGPLITVLLGGIAVILVGYVQTYRFLDERVKSLSSKADTYVEQLADLHATMTTTEQRIADINAAARISDAEWAKLNQAKDFIKLHGPTIDAASRLDEIERQLNAIAPGFPQIVRLSPAGPDFTAPEDGFIYVHCGDGHSAQVQLRHDNSMTTGGIQPTQSGMFPIRKGEIAFTLSATGPNPAAQVLIWYFGLRETSAAPTASPARP
jgi:hypothetical protein